MTKRGRNPAGYHAVKADHFGRGKCELRRTVGPPLFSDMDAFAYRGSRDVLSTAGWTWSPRRQTSGVGANWPLASNYASNLEMQAL